MLLKTLRWRELLIGLVGVWLIMSPSILGFETHRVAACNDYAAGGALAGFTLITAWRLIDRGENLLSILIGIWLMVCPYPLDFLQLHTAAVDSLLTGALVVALAVWQLSRR